MLVFLMLSVLNEKNSFVNSSLTYCNNWCFVVLAKACGKRLWSCQTLTSAQYIIVLDLGTVSMYSFASLAAAWSNNVRSRLEVEVKLEK